MWFIKLCLFVIAANICRMTGDYSTGLIISFAYICEVIKDLLKLYYLEANND